MVYGYSAGLHQISKCGMAYKMRHCFSNIGIQRLTYTSIWQILNRGTTCRSNVDLVEDQPRTNRSNNKPTWDVRRRNKMAGMPRPKSTGYLGDFNILTAADDYEDERDLAYDDIEVSRHVHSTTEISGSAKLFGNQNGYIRRAGRQQPHLKSERPSSIFEKDVLSTNKDGTAQICNDLDSLPVSQSSGAGDRIHSNNEDASWINKQNQSDRSFRKTQFPKRDNFVLTNNEDASWINKQNQSDPSFRKTQLPKRDDFVLTRDVSGRAAYWQTREDESNKGEAFDTSSGVLKNWKTPSQIRQMKEKIDEGQLNQFIYDADVVNRAALWQKREDDHFAKMIINPDKEWKGPAVRVVLDKSHPEYGRPYQGTQTEQRGIKAHKHVVKEIGELCQIIAETGDLQEDGTVTITFRKLFKTYVPISNKVVGILIRARKRGLLHFNGEMLYQRQDEDEIIKLFSVPDED